MAPKQTFAPHLKALEHALSARFGWQTGASWRDNLLCSISKKANRLGVDETSYCRLAVKSAAELETLADLVTNSETRFYREPEQFDALRESVFPELIEMRAEQRRLDLWSAACSTGEEAYSLAIAVCESVPANGNWRASLFATDLRGKSIISASHGRYTSSGIRMLEPQLRNRYFIKGETVGKERVYDVVPVVRNMIAFRRANLYDSHFWKTISQSFDLIVCNNLLLYFHALAAKQTVDRIAKVLKPGGVLVVMKNEAGYVNHPQLKLESSLPGAFFRKI